MNYKILIIIINFVFWVSSFAQALTIGTSAFRHSVGPLTEADSYTASSGAISSYVSGNDMWSKGYARAQANDNGTLTVSSSWEGTGYDIDFYESSSYFSETYYNNEQSTRYFYLDFNIPIYLQQIYGGAKVCVVPSSTIEVLLNGISIWESTTSMWADNNSPAEYYYSSDMDLIYIDNSVYDSIGDPLSYDVQLNGSYRNTFYLGFLKPGEYLSLEYNIYSASCGMDAGQTNSSIVAIGSVYSIPSPVPEPATMLLLGSGIIGLAGFRKKVQYLKLNRNEHEKIL